MHLQSHLDPLKCLPKQSDPDSSDVDLSQVMELELRELDNHFDAFASMSRDDPEEFMYDMYQVDSLSGGDVCVPLAHSNIMHTFPTGTQIGSEVMRMTAGRGGDIYKKTTRKYDLIKIWHSPEHSIAIFLGGTAVARADAMAEVAAKMQTNMYKKQRAYDALGAPRYRRYHPRATVWS